MNKPEDFGTIVFEFAMLYAGWECDDKCYVVRAADGTLNLVLSNHGHFYFAKASELEEKIAEYEQTIADTRKALEMLKK